MMVGGLKTLKWISAGSEAAVVFPELFNRVSVSAAEDQQQQTKQLLQLIMRYSSVSVRSLCLSVLRLSRDPSI